jgi:MFS family permease
MRRAAGLVLALYPRAWRTRYGAEMAVLLDDDPPNLGVLADLARGALIAHLRALRSVDAICSLEERMGLTVTGVLACVICFGIAGVGFAKETEDAAFQMAGHTHPLLAGARASAAVGAVAMGLALMLAAAPLAAVTVREAWRPRDRRLRWLALAPALAIGVLALATLALALYARTMHGGGLGVVGWIALLSWCAAGVLAAVVCWTAPRAILRRLVMPRAALAVSVGACAIAVVCMTAIALATALYLGSMLVDDPALASTANGPGGAAATSVSISLTLVAMAVPCALGALSATRGVRAARRLGERRDGRLGPSG